MEKYDSILQRVSENLLADEKLRSNLNDAEARILLDWAIDWLATQVGVAKSEASAKEIAQAELVRVRRALGAMNTLAKNRPAPRLGDALAVLPTWLDPQTPISRADIFSLLTTITRAVWNTKPGG